MNEHPASDGGGDRSPPDDPGHEPSFSERSWTNGRRASRCRRIFTAWAVVAVFAVSMLPPTLAVDDENEATPDAEDRRARERSSSRARVGKRAPVVQRDLSLERGAMKRGLRYLTRQQKNSGAIGGRFPVAVTSLAGLAYLGDGSGYSRGPHAVQIRKCVEYIVSSASKDGFLSERKLESRMHGHGMAILFLTQVYGDLPPDRQREVKDVVHEGIRCIVRGKSSRGGWTYHWINRVKDDDEASVTIGVVQALRAADNIGFTVDKNVIDDAIRYVKKSQTSDGSFQYSLNRTRSDAGKTSFALTAAAVSTLNAAGVYQSTELKSGLDFMARTLALKRGKPKRVIEDPFFYYGALYASQAYFQLGGPVWDSWYTELRSYLLRKQKSDGRWIDDAYGDEFGTAVATLIFAMPIQYLPIFQR